MSYGRSGKTQELILEAGLVLWPVTTARAIGRHIGMAHTSVLYQFKSAAELNLAIRQHALKTKNRAIIRQLIARNDSVVQSMPEKERFGYLGI